MTGAPIISGYSALKGGAGLVTLVVREDIYPLVSIQCTSRTHGYPSEGLS